MSKVIVYSKENCPWCDKAKELLTSRKIAYEEIRVDLDEDQLQKMIQLSNRRTVPQIFIDGIPMGGYDDLAALAKSGKLDELLKK